MNSKITFHAKQQLGGDNYVIKLCFVYEDPHSFHMLYDKRKQVCTYL